MSARRAAITGASGLLGGNLAILLREAGWEVRATRRAGSRVAHLAPYDLAWVEADLGDEDALAAAFSGVDAVFHCAASTSVRRQATRALWAANVEGTERVLAAFRRAGAGRLVHTSSTAAVGVSPDGVPCTEESRWNLPDYGLDDGYSTTKRESELRVQAAAAAGLDVVIANPAFMLGPFDSKPSSGALIVEVVRGGVFGTVPGWNNFVDVRDVARGLLALYERGRRGERYILGGENLCYRDLIRRIAAEARTRPPRLDVPWAVARALGLGGDLWERISGGEPRLNSATMRWAFTGRYRVNSDKARRELDYAPGPIEVAIRDAIAWFRGAGLLR